MQIGITEHCKNAFNNGITSVDGVLEYLRSKDILYRETSVRAIVSELRKNGHLVSQRGRPRTISVEIERAFKNGLESVAEILLHLRSNGIVHSPQTVRTLVQGLRKQHQKQRDNNEPDTPCCTNRKHVPRNQP